MKLQTYRYHTTIPPGLPNHHNLKVEKSKPMKIPVSAIKQRASSVGNPHTAGLGWREDKISNCNINQEAKKG